MTPTVVASRPKDPDAVLDYVLDWATWLGTDTIVASSWAVPTGITDTVGSPAIFTDTTTTIWLSGGTAGQVYDLVNHIVTAGGREEDCTLRLTVGDH